MKVLVQFISVSCFLFSVTLVQGREIRCEVPRDQHLSSPFSFFWGERTLGAKKPYSCRSGYKQMAAEATCTQDGWIPKPLCAAKQKLCPDLSVENGLIYSTEEKIIYSCNTGYKTFTGNWWDSVTCSEGSWSEEPQCITVEECGAFPSVHHGKLNQLKKIFRDGETTAFECDPGFISTPRLIKCVSGTWETPVCEVGVQCGIPPKLENAFITSKPEELYVDGSSVTYICQKSFSMMGDGSVSCRNGIWDKTPTCKEVMCVLNLPESMISDIHPGPEVSVRPGQTVTLSCDGEGLELQGRSRIWCLESGEWNVPFPKCVREKCGRPPKVNSGDTTEMTKLEYNSGERVEYRCFSKFTLDQRPPYSKYLTCDQGEWKGNIKCLKPCTVTVEEMDKRGIQLHWIGNQKMFVPHEDHITFACQKGKRLIVNELREKCNDGVITLPECE